ncbi:hypothetical protein DFH08DRAFT_951011 [Mycena albidolilacea]|uniref:Uncharacterized protein n=1 Tax=Mycena albidolilacea TaxID=1033008 RepID=A0AAD7F1B0_9AGAR|nr:hypothetical protein DFH08DRAFT_951011 [Mycena albidolilacea]
MPISSVMTPPISASKTTGSALLPSSLNWLQVKVLLAKLMGAVDADVLEREEEGRVRHKVEMLPTLDGQGRLYNVGYSAACSGTALLGDMKVSVPAHPGTADMSIDVHRGVVCPPPTLPAAARLLVHLRIPWPACPACCLFTRCPFALPAPCVIADYPTPDPSTPLTVTLLPAELIALHSIPALRAHSPPPRARLLSSAHTTQCRILAAHTLHTIPTVHDRSARACSFLTTVCSSLLLPRALPGLTRSLASRAPWPHALPGLTRSLPI